eukprot:scaffold25841_cov31-Tisochrysis_lutea.AAC.1
MADTQRRSSRGLSFVLNSGRVWQQSMKKSDSTSSEATICWNVMYPSSKRRRAFSYVGIPGNRLSRP